MKSVRFGNVNIPNLGLFSPFFTDGLCTSKHETKYLAFGLLERAVTRCDAKQLRAVFSEKLVRSMINNLANKQAILHSAALKLVRSPRVRERPIALLESITESQNTLEQPIFCLVNWLNYEFIFLRITREWNCEIQANWSWLSDRNVPHYFQNIFHILYCPCYRKFLLSYNFTFPISVTKVQYMQQQKWYVKKKLGAEKL